MIDIIDNFFYDDWPQDILGSRIYKKEQLIEMLLVYYIWGNLYNTTFKKAEKQEREKLLLLKEKINQQYSYLNRLCITNEINKIYKKVKNGVQKRIAAKIKEKERYKINVKIYKEILNQFPELENKLINSTQFVIEEKICPIELKKDWVKAERAKIKSELDRYKETLDDMQKNFNKKVFLYNKLKNKIGDTL